MEATEACEECTHKCLLNHRQKKDPSPQITSFYKLMYGKYNFEEYLCLPPRVRIIIPGLADGKNYILEDCNGKRSTVTLGTRDGDLAFTEGWDEFYAEHGLTEGDIVLFNYTPSRFAVRIFNSTCCEKVNFVKTNNKKRKRSTTDGNLDAEDGQRHKSPDGSTRKHGSATSIRSKFVDRAQSKFTTNGQPANNLGLSGQGGRSQSEPMSKDKSPTSENGNFRFQPASPADTNMIDRDAVYRHDEKRVDHSFDMQTGVDAEGNNGKEFHRTNTLMEPGTGKSILNENPVSKKVVSDELHREVAAKMLKRTNVSSTRETKEPVDNGHRDGNPSVPLIDKQARGHADTSMNKEVEIINNDHGGNPAGQQFETQASEHAKSILVSKKVEVGTSTSKEVEIVNNDHGGDPAGRQFETQASEHAKSIPVSEKVEQAHNDHHDGNSSGPPLETPSAVHAKSTIKSSTSKKEKKKMVRRKEATGKEKLPSELLEVPKKVLMEVGKTPSGEQTGKSYNENRTSSGAKGTYVAVKTEPVDSSDDRDVEGSGSSFVVTVESQELLVLPNTNGIGKEGAKEIRKVVALKGPDNQGWPALYHRKHGVQALTSGWKHFFKTYNLQTGFELTFTPDTEAEPEPGNDYKVEINRK